MTFEILLVVGLLGSVYSYFIYPLILLLLTKMGVAAQKQSPTDNISVLPTITFIITAYNEASHIIQKLDNTLAANYPADKLEVIVASDGSTDETNALVEKYHEKSVKLLNVKDRKGKENAQRSAIQIAQGEILVFSDVSTQIEQQSLRQISRAFEDVGVGAVSSEDRFLSKDGKLVGEGAYVKYEMWLRNLESSINSLVGLSGSFFAARKNICHQWDISVPSDFNTALNCVNQGYRSISDPELLGFYPDLKPGGKEFQRKVRTVIRGIAALFNKPSVLNPFKFGFFSFQVVSHKLMRWLVPWFLIVTFISNVALVDKHYFFQFLLLTQTAFYTAAVWGLFSKRAQNIGIIKLCFFFVQVNMAILQASLMYIVGKRITKWEPSKR